MEIRAEYRLVKKVCMKMKGVVRTERLELRA
jgi:hypothetical protein